jgi:hypothetical protein
LDIHETDGRAPRRDQHELVFEQIETGVRPDQILLLSVIHPIEIRGKEDVRRRTVFNPLDERVAGRVGNDRFLSGLALPVSGNLVESVLQACGRKYDNILALRRGWLNSPDPRQSRGDEQGEPSTSCRHHSQRLRYSSKHIGRDNTAAFGWFNHRWGHPSTSLRAPTAELLEPWRVVFAGEGFRRMDQVDAVRPGLKL